MLSVREFWFLTLSDKTDAMQSCAYAFIVFAACAKHQTYAWVIAITQTFLATLAASTVQGLVK